MPIACPVSYSRKDAANKEAYSDARGYMMAAISRYSGRNPDGWIRILTNQKKREAINNIAWEKELVMKGYVHDCGVAIGHVTKKLDGILNIL